MLQSPQLPLGLLPCEVEFQLMYTLLAFFFFFFFTYHAPYSVYFSELLPKQTAYTKVLATILALGELQGHSPFIMPLVIIWES